MNIKLIVLVFFLIILIVIINEITNQIVSKNLAENMLRGISFIQKLIKKIDYLNLYRNERRVESI
jgi:hypothetical protein